MAYRLESTYGKQAVPVFKLRKGGRMHEVVDLEVKIMLEGQVADSWLTGDNHQIVPTETQKNTCYALALKTEYDCGEDYAIALGKDMLTRHKHITAVNLEVKERVWERVHIDGKPHSHVFFAARDPIKRFCRVRVTRTAAPVVTSGLIDIKLMKTTQSGFAGYIEDEYTNLQPVGAGSASPDRIMCTLLESSWSYARPPATGYAKANKAIFDSLVEHWSGPVDTGRFSKSVQETAYIMATKTLDRFQELSEVFLATPNIHHYPYPLAQFGMSNPNIVFQSTDSVTTASGRIETRVKRMGSKL